MNKRDWNNLKSGDTILSKRSGKPVKVLQTYKTYYSDMVDVKTESEHGTAFHPPRDRKRYKIKRNG